MKKTISAVLAVLMLMSLCACGKTAKDVDVSALARDLASQLAFDGEMTAMDADEIAFTFDVPNGAVAAGYRSAGTTTETIVCVQCADSESAAPVLSAAESYVDGLVDDAQKYNPAEAERLSGGTYVCRFDNLVVLVVATDVSSVTAIVEGYTK